jgi:hypothetical protein
VPRVESDRRGVALLEALIALAILSSAGIATVALVASSLRAERDVRDRERETSSAERVLVASTLLTRADLDLRLGDRRVGEFVINVTRPEQTLYRIGIADTIAPGLELLTTVVYRPQSEAP